jgi:hypothetical protein
MTRRATWAVVAVIGLTAAGCGDGTRTIATARPIDTGGTAQAVVLPKDPPPTTSDPASRALLDEMLKAHTGGDPAKIERLRSVVVSRTGRVTLESGPGKATWEFRWVWPDKFRVRAETEGHPTLLIGRNGDTAWTAPAPLPGEPAPTKLPVGEPKIRGVMADSYGESLALLVPLVEPGVVVSPHTDLEIKDKDDKKKVFAGLRVSGKGYPPTVIHVDRETKLLAHFTYEGWEQTTVTKEVTIGGLKEFDGVKLPERLFIKWNGRDFAEWTVTGVEAQANHEPKLFEGP